MKKTSLKPIFAAWWPLAASWLLMGMELPLVSAVMARLPDPKISLAAYGGVVFQLALIIEAPIIMLLAASTALSRDLASYRKLFKFMMWAGGTLTVLHVLLAFTPLFDVVVTGWMGVPAEIIEPTRLGLKIMTPWTWTIAYRRFQQGLLIRFNRSRAVSTGTLLRLGSNALTLLAGSLLGLQGIVVGTGAIAAGVIVEAIYAGWAAAPVVRGPLANAAPVDPPLSPRAFFDFYTPLAATSVINLVVQPMGSAAMSRMLLPVESLAVWPVLGGLLFMWRSMGFAFNEVVVAMLDEPGAAKRLGVFAQRLALFVTVGVGVLAASPLGEFWFATVSGLSPDLTALARAGLWLGLGWPALSVIQNYFQGVIVHGRRTTGLTSSMFLFVALTAALLFAGTAANRFTGLLVALVAFQVGYAGQAAYLWWICRPILKQHAHAHLPGRDPAPLSTQQWIE